MADEGSSSTSYLCDHICWHAPHCRRKAPHYFLCSRRDCPGPPGSSGNHPRIALCDRCAHEGACPFCRANIQREDLQSVTDKPATSTGSADGDRGQRSNGPAASSQTDHQTLEQYNQRLEELANQVQKRVRELKRELAISVSDHPEIVELVEEGKELFRSLTCHKLQPDHVTYRWMISLCARAKDQEQVEKWANEMEKSGKYSRDAYNSAMFAYAVPGGVDRADMWFQRMNQKGVAPDVKSYNILIQACALCSDSTHAYLYFERMQAAEIKPDVWTFSHLISACAKGKKNPHSLQKAEGIWRNMQQADVKPINFTFLRMLKVCANAGNIRRASYFFDQSIQAECKPDVVTFTTMISVFIKTGCVQGAEDWFGKMESAGVKPNVAAFSCVIRVCGTRGDVQSARKWLAKLEAASFKPTWHTYEALIICELNRKDFTQADLWLHRMLDSGVTRTLKTFHILLQACEPSGNLLQAEHWFNVMVSAGVQPDVHAFNSMLRTSAVHDSSIVRRIRGQPCQEQRTWFLKMSSSDVHPNEDTHKILTDSRNSTFFATSSAILIVVVAASLSFLLKGKTAVR